MQQPPDRPPPPYQASPYAPSPMGLPGGPYAPNPQGPSGWEPGEVFSEAMDRFKDNWGVFVGAGVTSFAVGLIPSFIDGGFRAIASAGGRGHDMQNVFLAVQLVMTVAGWAIGLFFQAGLIKMAAKAIRQEQVTFGDAFSGGSRMPTLFVAYFLMGVAWVLGTICFIVPGIILSLGLFLTPMFVVEAEMRPIAAMKASWEATNGHKGKIFVFSFLMCLALFAGVMLCGVGYFAALPITTIATVIIYLRLTGRGAAQAPSDPWASAPGGMAPPGHIAPGAAPPGGFGGSSGYGPGGGYGPPGT